MRKEANDLFLITQRKRKNLKSYVQSLNKEKVEIVDCEESMAAIAFRKGVFKDNLLYDSLAKNQLQTMADSFLQARTYINFEDHKQDKRNKVEEGKKKTTHRKGKLKRQEPKRDFKSMRNKDDHLFNYFKHYPLSVTPENMVKHLQNKYYVKRLKKMYSDLKDKNLAIFYTFHNDIGHLIEDCRQLR